MIGFILTFDYEIYGDGTGTIVEHMLDPTDKFLALCDAFGVKATLFVEVAELLKMKAYPQFYDDVCKVERQLRQAHENGHDIQLHIHPWWFNAKFLDGQWRPDYRMSSLCHLKRNEALKYILLCKRYLHELLEQCEREYACVAFRSGAWAMMPTENIYDALIEAGIEFETSVYKWGAMRTEYMKFDYSNAHSNICPWFFSREDVNKAEVYSEKNPACLELPIYAEYQLGWRFVTRKRISLMSNVKSAISDHDSSELNESFKKALLNKLRFLIKKKAKKFDLCKCTLGEMKKMIHNIVKYNPVEGYLPVVTIGHSKDFIIHNDLEKLLTFLKQNYPDIIEIVPLSVAAGKYRFFCE